ncbi:MAG: Wzz/FepE/Etk N-terminal domain-containing protein [Candidatus Omnitrophota bacterium]
MVAEKEISLNAVVNVIWDRGRRILYFTAVSMFLGMIATFIVHNRYESHALLLMNKSRLGQETMKNPAIPMDTYVTMITADDVMQDIMQKYQLRSSPYNLRYPNDMRGRVQVYYLLGSSYLSISVVLEDPVLAADVANDLAERAIAKNRELMAGEKSSSQQLISSEIQTIEQRKIKFKKDYLDLLLKNNKQVLMKELDTNQTILATLRQEKETLDNSIREQEEKMVKFKALFFDPQFERHPDFQKIVPVWKSIFSDNASLELVKAATENVDISALAQMGIHDEMLNTGYITLLQEYSKLQVDLPSLIAKQVRTASRIAEVEAKVEEQNKAFNEMDVAETEAKADFDRELEVFSGVYKNLGWAGTTISSERQDLILSNKAIPIKKKIWPRRSMIIALVGLVAFLMALMYYLLADLYGMLHSGIWTKKENPTET